MMGPMHSVQGMEWMGWGMWLFPLLAILLTVALIAAVVWLGIAIARQGRDTGMEPR